MKPLQKATKPPIQPPSRRKLKSEGVLLELVVGLGGSHLPSTPLSRKFATGKSRFRKRRQVGHGKEIKPWALENAKTWAHVFSGFCSFFAGVGLQRAACVAHMARAVLRKSMFFGCESVCSCVSCLCCFLLSTWDTRMTPTQRHQTAFCYKSEQRHTRSPEPGMFLLGLRLRVLGKPAWGRHEYA